MKACVALLFLLCGAYAAKDYTVYCVGNCNNKIKTNPLGGILLAGGGTDVDDGMKWMIDQSKQGDFVVLRASGTDAYNQYLLDLGHPNSVTTIIFNNRNGASAQEVLDIVNDAEAIFFAGGDQSDYVDFWYNTPLSGALSAAIVNNVVFGGTSAGCMILGQFVYSASAGSVTSDEALQNPYNRYMTFAGQFLSFKFLYGIITDTHFVTRDRMGRLAAFIARLRQDGNSSYPYGVGIDEVTNFAINATGQAQMFGTGTAYIIQSSSGPTTCRSFTPLTYPNVRAVRLDPKKGDTWDFATMTSSSGVYYSYSISSGSFVGSPYGP